MAATNKRTVDEEFESTGDSGWGCPRGKNRDNPALARQDPGKETNNCTPDLSICAFWTIRLAIDPRRYITDLSSKINFYAETTLELDSHTDTCVLGYNALLFLEFEQPVVVQGYDPTLGTKTFATVSGALAYDNRYTGKVFHLVVNQAIHIPHLNHHILCPMQC